MVHPNVVAPEVFMRSYESLNDAAIRLSKQPPTPEQCGGAMKRFGRGVYGHPKSWWAGNITVLARTGALGHEKKRISDLHNAVLSQSLFWIFQSEEKMLIAKKTIAYQLKYNKAAIAGRTIGGGFTGFALSGGYLGNKRLKGHKFEKRIRRSRFIINLIIASYGAGILAIAEGLRSTDKIVAAILTGDNKSSKCMVGVNLSDEDLEAVENTSQFLACIELLEASYGFCSHGKDMFDE